MITQEQAKELFTYKDGQLFWTKTGKVAGSLKKNGYYSVSYKRKFTGIHRIIFLIHNGYLPEMVDHIDGNVANNCAENLRAASRSQNGMNSKFYSSNTSGSRNVYKCNSKYSVRLKIDGKFRNFGLYENLELADLVAQEARNKFYGEYAYQALRTRLTALENK